MIELFYLVLNDKSAFLNAMGVVFSVFLIVWLLSSLND